MRSKTEVQSLHETGSVITSQRSHFLKEKETREEKKNKRKKNEVTFRQSERNIFMKKSTMRNSTVALKHCFLRNISSTAKKEQNAQISAPFLVNSKIPKILFHKMFAILLLTTPDF